MNKKMKVMIGYDGSIHADAAIDDLSRAGIERDAEVRVVSVLKDPWVMPYVSELDLVSLASSRAEAVMSRSAAHRRHLIRETKEMAARAAERVRWQMPSWTVSSEIIEGEPADELLGYAKEWKPDLIVVGSQGRSAIGRFFLGSVSTRIADEARTSVRVVRREADPVPDRALTVVAGAATLNDAERLIETLGRRVWPDDSKLKLVAVDDGVTEGRVSAVYPYAADIFAQSAKPLGAIGIDVSVDVLRGEAKILLLDAAEILDADAIFIVANSDAEAPDSLGETARALVTDASCTVEIVRQNEFTESR